MTTPHTRPLPAPQPLPRLQTTPGMAHEGAERLNALRARAVSRLVAVVWWQGISLGCVIGGGAVYVFLHAIGRLVP